MKTPIAYVIALFVFVGIALTFVVSRRAPSPPIVPGVPSLSYADARYGFSLDYPQGAAIDETEYGGYLPKTETAVVGFFLPRSLFEGTNLGEAGVFIGATSTPSIVSSCTSPLADYGESSAGTAAIGGVAFSVATTTGVGAGQIYESTIFRTVRGGNCLEIVELLHSGNIGMYTPGAVVQFDKEKFQGYLDRIVNSLSFGNHR